MFAVAVVVLNSLLFPPAGFLPRETVSFGELVSMLGFQRNSFREIWLNVKCQDRDKDYTEIHEEIVVLVLSRAEDRYTESHNWPIFRPTVLINTGFKLKKRVSLDRS